MFRTGSPDLIRRSIRGGVVSARNLTRIANAATRFRSVGPAIMDGTGIYSRPPVAPQVVQLERRLELKNALTPGGSTIAHPLPWTGAAYVVDTDESKEFEVFDVLKKFRGRGKDQYTIPTGHEQGSQGYARLMPDSERWELIDLTPNALLIRGKATGDWTDPTMTIDDVVVMEPDGGLIVDQNPGDPMTISDFFDWDGKDNNNIFAYWDQAVVAWKLAMKPCT